MSSILNSLSLTNPSNTAQLPASTTGAASANQSLTPADFINFLVTELQNQDPLDPTDPNQMLTQMSQIGQLESADSTQTALQGMVQQNQVSAAAGMIGKQVQGTDQNNNAINGIVSAVQVTTKGVNLQLTSGDSVSLANVTIITNPSTTGTTQ